ncbi:MAG: L,D-transpeptidase family protein [Bacillota bacterium]
MRLRSLVLLSFLLTFLVLVYAAGHCCSWQVKPGSDKDPNATEILINFLLPMQQDPLIGKVTVTPEIPLTAVSYKINWLGPTTMILKIQQAGFPQGQLLNFQISGAPSLLPFIKKSVNGKFRPPVSLKLLTAPKLKNIPSRGPVPIVFNTPVDPESMKQSVVLPAPGRLQPVRFSVDGQNCVDYSRWQYVPGTPFANGQTYRIAIRPGLRAMSGTVLQTYQEITFTIAKPACVVDTTPPAGAEGVWLYRNVEFHLDREVSAASVRVTDFREEIDIPGDTEVAQRTVIFRPAYAFMPGKTYKAKLLAKSKDNELLDEYEFSFTTVDMDERIWVEVKLGERHTVTVYRGSRRIRHMVASGGRPETPTPTGVFYTQDRGYSFWSHRFQEGATYWVRLRGQLLVHSVPRDSQWKIKEEEHAKLGLPASHGCIRLDEKNAKWFFENIPRDTPVIIHDRT